MRTDWLNFFRRGLSSGLIWLLALGPFLHSHLGASHETGFHLDGIHALQASVQDTASPWQAQEDDSPALGVDPTLRHVEMPAPGWLGVLLFTLVPLLAPRFIWRIRPSRSATLPPLRTYAPGGPPPVLAPPVA